MKAKSILPKESNDGKSISAPLHSKLGIIGLVLSILGCIVSLGALWIIVFIIVAGGALDVLDAPMEELTFVTYAGLFFGIIGGILGVMSLLRRENRIVSTISLVLGILMLGTCSVFTLLFVVSIFSLR